MIGKLLNNLKAGPTPSIETDEALLPEDRDPFAGWPMILGWMAMLIFAFHACTHMVAAGDTWVAMACGRHFINHGVDTVEPFSANSHKAGPTAEEVETWPKWAQGITKAVGLETVKFWHPTGWVNQNWLTHVIFYWLTTSLGSEAEPYFDALVLWKVSLYVLAAVCLFYTTRIYGVNRALGVTFVCFALFIGRSFFDVRPAGFSNLLVAVFMLVLALASYRNALYVWLLVPLIVFWANVHGGYVYAFIVLVPFVFWHAIMNLPRRWTIAAYSISTWLVLYGLAQMFRRHEYLKAIGVLEDWAFYLLVLAVVASIVLTRRRQIDDGAVIAFHATASCVSCLLLLTRFSVRLPLSIGARERADLSQHVTSSLLAYLGIFCFAMLLGALVVSLKDKVVRVMPPRGVAHTIGVGLVAFVAMVLFNPFHLTNLTHTFVISVSKHAERWRDVHEWHRAFDWKNPVGTAVPFLVMYILSWLVLALCVVVFLRVRSRSKPPSKKRDRAVDTYPWTQVDFGLLVIAALTVYMAIRSRRFIPIAGFAACPIVAMLLDQSIRALAALLRGPDEGRLQALPMSREARLAVIGAGAVATLLFGIAWGQRFKRVYLDYWPADPRLKSVFMRMTASDAKPFYASQFLRDNEFSGKMFNYWTEGGFIAYGQTPDPNTGRTPLQLFMDGRAQAAYDVRAFDQWTLIMSGGEVVRRAHYAGRRLTQADYMQIEQWVSARLRDRDVWAVMMPANQFDKPFTKALEHSIDWRVVFMNNKQKIFVDVKDRRGKAVYEGMFTGQTTYPDTFTADLSLGHNLLLIQDMAQKRRGLERLIRAFEENPSPAPILEMLLIAAQFPELRPRLEGVCQEYADDFEKNKATYEGTDGYNFRLEAARLALVRLEQTARTAGNRKLAQTYANRRAAYAQERNWISEKKRW